MRTGSVVISRSRSRARMGLHSEGRAGAKVLRSSRAGGSALAGVDLSSATEAVEGPGWSCAARARTGFHTDFSSEDWVRATA